MGSNSLTKGSNPGPLHWESRVLATGPRGESQDKSIFVVLSHQVVVLFKMAALGNQHSFQRQETLFVKTRNLVSYLGKTLVLTVSMLWNPLEGLLKYKLLGFTGVSRPMLKSALLGDAHTAGPRTTLRE